MKKKTKDKEKKFDFVSSPENNIENLLLTLSHYEAHTLAAALLFACRVLNVVDPDGDFKSTVTTQQLLNQDHNDVIRLTRDFADQAKASYQRNKDEIDLTFNKRKLH